MTVDRKHCYDASRQLGENNDCTVRACAVAADIPYLDMHQYLKEECGREKGKGLHSYQYHRALEALGFTLTKLEGPKYEFRHNWVAGQWKHNWRTGTEYYVNEHYRCTRRKVSKGKDYNGATVRTLAKELIGGTYLVNTDGHVLCIKDGEVHDFTKDRMHRVEAVYKVTC